MNISRRQMLIGAAGSAFAIGLALHQSGKVAYRLEAMGSCRKCNACREHASHKWFATPDAVQRAHLHCKCKVLAVRVTEQQYEEMFGTAHHFDMRRAVRMV